MRAQLADAHVILAACGVQQRRVFATRLVTGAGARGAGGSAARGGAAIHGDARRRLARAGRGAIRGCAAGPGAPPGGACVRRMLSGEPALMGRPARARATSACSSAERQQSRAALCAGALAPGGQQCRGRQSAVSAGNRGARRGRVMRIGLGGSVHKGRTRLASRTPWRPGKPAVVCGGALRGCCARAARPAGGQHRRGRRGALQGGPAGRRAVGGGARRRCGPRRGGRGPGRAPGGRGQSGRPCGRVRRARAGGRLCAYRRLLAGRRCPRWVVIWRCGIEHRTDRAPHSEMILRQAAGRLR